MPTKEDSQLTCMAGEFLVVSKLFKRRYQASVTLGNAKAIDVLAYNPATGKNFAVQVKTLRRRNCFPIDRKAIKADHVYIFVFLNAFEDTEEFFIVPGAEILADIDRFFGSSFRNPDKPSPVPAINYGPLSPYKNNWGLFDR
jgi:hypothetical protein